MMAHPLKVFLSYNSDDRSQVESIGLRLRKAGFNAWFDDWHLSAGDIWQEKLEEALKTSDVCLVFIGKQGLGPWHKAEVRVALNSNITQQGLRVIPVLLPDAQQGAIAMLPSFLQAYKAVSFYKSLQDTSAFRRLVSGIRSENPGPDIVDDLANPYRGLQYFDIKHAPFFFGRIAVTKQLLSYLQPTCSLQVSEEASIPRFLAIIGASGSGKSSLARAGLLASLGEGVLPTSEDWPQLIVKPGKKPLQSLAVAINANTDVSNRLDIPELINKFHKDPLSLHYLGLECINGDEEAYLLILIDQFEEVFSLCSDKNEREAFLKNLLSAATEPTGRVVVILTVRADFYANCSAYPQLSRCIENQQYLLNPMDEMELHEAIIFPARDMGCELEEGLVELIVRDVQEQPGTLPLLQFALMQLWEQRESKSLRLVDYQKFGGLAGALELRANQIYEGFSAEFQNKCRQVFRRLIQPGDGAVDTRRRCLLEEFDGDQDALRVIQVLTNARLLTSQQENGIAFVEVSHEVLIRKWLQLRKWVNEDRECLLLQHQISNAASEWKENGEEGSWLLTGARLLAAEKWLEFSTQDASDLDKRFIEESASLRNLENTAILKHQFKSKWSTRAVVILLVVALLIGTYAKQFFDDLRESSNNLKSDIGKINTESKKKAGTLISLIFENSEISRLERNYLVGELLQTKAERNYEKWQTLKEPSFIQKALINFLDSLSLEIPMNKTLDDQRFLSTLALLDESDFSPREKNNKKIVNVLETKPVTVNSFDFSPDGKNIVLSTSDNTISIWSLGAGGSNKVLYRPSKNIVDLKYDLSGKKIILFSFQGDVEVIDVTTGELLANTDEVGPSIILSFGSYLYESYINNSDYNTTTLDDFNNRMIEVWSKSLSVFDTSYPTGIPTYKVAYNNSKERVAISLYNPYEIEYESPYSVTLSGEPGFYQKMMLEEEQLHIEVKEEPNQCVFDLDSYVNGPSGYVDSIERCFNNVVLLSGKFPKDVPKQLRDPVGAASLMEYSNDGEILATYHLATSSGYNDVINFWDVGTGKIINSLHSNSYRINALTFSPDGKKIALGFDTGVIQVRNVLSGKVIYHLETRIPPNFSNQPLLPEVTLKFSADGQSLGYASNDNYVRLWRFTDPVFRLLHEFDPQEVSKALKVIWQIKLDESEREYITDLENIVGKEYDLLQEAPKLGESKLGQLIRWLENRKAYRNVTIHQPLLLKHAP